MPLCPSLLLTAVHLPPFWCSCNPLHPERPLVWNWSLSTKATQVSQFTAGHHVRTALNSHLPSPRDASQHMQYPNASASCAIISHFQHNHLIQCQLLLHHLAPNFCRPEFSISVSCLMPILNVTRRQQLNTWKAQLCLGALSLLGGPCSRRKPHNKIWDGEGEAL